MCFHSKDYQLLSALNRNPIENRESVSNSFYKQRSMSHTVRPTPVYLLRLQSHWFCRFSSDIPRNTCSGGQSNAPYRPTSSRRSERLATSFAPSASSGASRTSHLRMRGTPSCRSATCATGSSRTRRRCRRLCRASAASSTRRRRGTRNNSPCIRPSVTGSCWRATWARVTSHTD